MKPCGGIEVTCQDDMLDLRKRVEEAKERLARKGKGRGKPQIPDFPHKS